MADNSGTVLVLGALGVGIWLVATKRIDLSAPKKTPPAGGVVPAGAPPKTATCDPSFKAGVQYVAPYPGGGYEAVVGGRQVAWSYDLGYVEREYNRLVCAG